MARLRALPLLLLLALAPGAAADGLQRLLSDLARWSRRTAQTDGARLEAGEALLREVDRTWTSDAPGGEELLLAMLDFLGRCQRVERERPLLGPAPEGGLTLVTEADLRSRALAMLRRRLPRLERDLALGVLAGRVGDGPHPLGRRAAACEVLAGSPTGTATLALLATTRPAPPELEVPPELLDAAVSALAGRESDGVHLRLIYLLGAADAGSVRMHRSLLEKHFRSIRLEKEDTRVSSSVEAHVLPALASTDWRRASRAVAVSRCLPDERALPILIDALEDWLARADDPARPVRRVQGELASELERRSGRRYGPRPERWRALLEGWRRGETPLAGESGAPLHPTESGFFGLRPSTDRVTFLLDCSGSMEARFGSARGPSRLEEAAGQMRTLLEQLGPRTRFNVVVFADGARRWRETLAPAEEDALRAATRFVLRTGAGGGTRLQEGVRLALHLGEDGRPDLEALEADTVIVLCDGGTQEGPGWIAPFLQEANEDARVVFHAVQLGQGGDGALEALCAGSGGEFVRVDG